MKYNRTELDAQYNLRLRHPDFQNFLDQNEHESERVRQTYPCRLDIPYGRRFGERLDIFPAERPNAPIHLFIHGGYWQMLDKKSHSFIAEPFIKAGCAVVVINYTLAPEADMDEIVRQSRAAIAWTFNNARTFNADPSRIYLSGHSAGGHLVAMMMATDWMDEWGLAADPIKGGCAISGIFDLEPIRLCYLNEAIGMDKQASRRNSPIYHLPKGAAPLIVSVGSLETDEFLRHASEFSTALEDAGHPYECLVLPGHHHYSVVQELGKEKSILIDAIFRQMSL
jgi:arylformamidase